MKKYRLAAAFVCVTVMLSGCSEENGRQETETDDSSVTSAVTGEVVPVFIEDTKITDKGFVSPESVVCMSGSLAEIVFELGFGDRIKARGAYCTYPERLSELPDAGRPTAPDIEAIGKAHAGLLLTATAVSSMDKAAIENMGTQVVYIPAPKDLNELEGIYAEVSRLFTDSEEAGRAVFSDIKRELEQSGADIGRFVYITEGMCAAGGNTFEGSVLSLFGENAAGTISGYTDELSFMIENAPDTVLIAGKELPEGILIPQTAKIIYLDSAIFESPSGRLRELVSVLS